MYDNTDQQPLDESPQMLYMFTREASCIDFGDTFGETFSVTIRLMFMV